MKIIGALLLSISLVFFTHALPVEVPRANYSWQPAYDARESLAARIAVPRGFERETVAAGSFAEWLRSLPLKKGNPPVHLYDGRLKANQGVHAAVIDIDTGSKD